MDERNNNAKLVEGIKAHKAFNVCWTEDGINIAAPETELMVKICGQSFNLGNKFGTLNTLVHVLNSVKIAVLLSRCAVKFKAVIVTGFNHFISHHFFLLILSYKYQPILWPSLSLISLLPRKGRVSEPVMVSPSKVTAASIIFPGRRVISPLP